MAIKLSPRRTQRTLAAAVIAGAGIVAINSAEAAQFDEKTATYTVEAGDTLGAIAKDASKRLAALGVSGITYKKIAADNNDKTPGAIDIGQKFQVKKLLDAQVAAIPAAAKAIEGVKDNIVTATVIPVPTAKPAIKNVILVAQTATTEPAAETQKVNTDAKKLAEDCEKAKAALSAIDERVGTEKAQLAAAKKLVADLEAQLVAARTAQVREAAEVSAAEAERTNIAAKEKADCSKCTEEVTQPVKKAEAKSPVAPKTTPIVVSRDVPKEKIKTEKRNPVKASVTGGKKETPASKKPASKPVVQVAEKGCTPTVGMLDSNAPNNQHFRLYNQWKSGTDKGALSKLQKLVCGSGAISEVKGGGKVPDVSINKYCRAVFNGSSFTAVPKQERWNTECCSVNITKFREINGKWVPLYAGGSCQKPDGGRPSEPRDNEGDFGGGCQSSCGGVDPGHTPGGGNDPEAEFGLIDLKKIVPGPVIKASGLELNIA